MTSSAGSLGAGILAAVVLGLTALLLLGAWLSRAPPLAPGRVRELLAAPVDTIPSRGFEVPVNELFAGVSAAGGVGFAKNSLSPRLTFFPDRVAVHVLLRREIAWGYVREADLVPALGAPLLILHFSNGDYISARLFNDAWRIRTLRILEHCGVSLGAHARLFLARMRAIAEAA